MRSRRLPNYCDGFICFGGELSLPSHLNVTQTAGGGRTHILDMINKKIKTHIGIVLDSMWLSR